MSGADRLFGVYQPRGTVIERVPAGWKYLGFLALTLPAFLVRLWWVTVICLVIAGILVLATRLGLRRGLGLPRGVIALLAVLAVFQGITATWLAGFVLIGNLVLAIWASRLIVMTTPTPVLIDALVTVARPLRVIGLSPQRFGLAIAIMLRSIPYLMGEFTTIRQAARARGLERHLFGQITQVVIKAVAYGQTTGDAIAARGLGD